MSALFRRRLRAAALVLLSLPLTACAHAQPAGPDPHVTMPGGSLRTAALECAARGFAYVARSGPTSALCLWTNPEHEPEAQPVRSILAQP